MASAMNGTLDVTRKGDSFLDEYGDSWIISADDMCGCFAVNREDGMRAGLISTKTGEAVLYAAKDGGTFGVNCTEEFVVRDDQWEANEDV